MSSNPQIRTVSFDDQEAIRTAIRNHETFEVGGCQGRMDEAVLFVERAIGGEGMSSRVFTKGRAAALAAGMVVPAAAAAMAVAIAAHKLATLNPDYEIMRRPVDKALRLTYVKDDPSLSQQIKEMAVVVGEGVSTTASMAASAASRAVGYERVKAKGFREGQEMAAASYAAKLQALQEDFIPALEHYENQNKANQFTIGLIAVGAAMAACDGRIGDDELSHLSEFVLGASAQAAPSAIQEAIRTLMEQPPTFESAMSYVEKLDRGTWPVIDDILAIVSQADGVISEAEKTFLDKWAEYKADRMQVEHV